jgi:hypothetical protein
MWWYYAKVENATGIHTVFYANTRPKIGDSCLGIAEPNKVIGFERKREYY